MALALGNYLGNRPNAGEKGGGGTFNGLAF